MKRSSQARCRPVSLSSPLLSTTMATGIEKDMAKLSTSATTNIEQEIDRVTSDPNKIPDFVAVVVDRKGQCLFQHASGKRGVDTPEPITLESVFWIASCTKMVAGIAAMQLVEQGKLALDDADLVERLAPELRTVRILKGFDEKGKATLVEKKERITLRMLLSHTGNEFVMCAYPC